MLPACPPDGLRKTLNSSEGFHPMTLAFLSAVHRLLPTRTPPYPTTATRKILGSRRQAPPP